MCAALVAAYAFVVASWVPPLCPTRLLFHVPCPSCGLTRAARCLLHADLVGATRMHPLWWLVFPYVAVLLVLESTSYVRTGTVGTLTTHPRLGRLGVYVLVALVAVWAARALGAFGGPVPLD